jgi:lipoyl(octanoyl) transferase
MLDLNKRGRDVRAYVRDLEDWVTVVLSQFGVKGERRQDRVGVWVRRPGLGAGKEDKIAAIGVRVRRWVTFHGIALNVFPELEHYSGIVPCGVSEHGVTSLADLGMRVSMEEVDRALRTSFNARFGS